MPTVTKSLDEYWASQSSKLTAPTVSAGGATTGDESDGGVLTDAVTYDASTNTVHYDATTMQDVHDTIGDFGSGMLVASAWASSVQHQLGQGIGTDRPAAAPSASPVRGRRASRRRCRRATSTKRSPCWSRRARATPIEGSAFDRVAAFRAGFKHGPSKCVQSS